MSSSLLLASRFELQELLGRGGMGEVYRATDTQTGEIVAVKALNPGILAREPELLARFARESQALRRLNHPNIVHMISAVEEQGQYYLVMEFVEGGSLQDLLTSRRCLPANEIVKIALEVADALTRAHHLGIIHRDLKPANVLLAKDGTPRLADFGIAHMDDDQRLTQTGILVGTVDYLSPELCQGEPPDERSDIWAFGVLLFETLCGKLPFDGKSLTAKITSILTQPIPNLTQLAPDTPDALADLVYRMLEKDRQQRIPSMRLVGAELEAMLKGREPATPSRSSREEGRFTTPTPATIAPRHNLPVKSTPFVGREAELIELDRLLADPSVRLLSIVGVGGMGKTRLAIEAGARQLERFQHGVYFVALTGVQASEDIVPATAQALGFSFYEGREPRQQLLDYLREKKMLLIFDNFEHLLGDVSLVTDILRVASHVIALSTTRARLSSPEEHIYQLSGMDFPDWETPTNAMEYSAVKLFMQSARRVRPGFELAADDLKYIARICRLAGGMPLGILLAAAWLEMLSPSEIAAEMQKSLDFLSTDLTGVDERQRNIRAVLDYSWNSLTEQERSIFQQLPVFRGGFTREAVQAVTGASLRYLMGLVNKSLLTRASSGRYEIHEFLRQYGAEKLSSSPEIERATRDRHCAYFAEFLRQRESGLHGKDQRAILTEIGNEIENIRSGWEWAVEHVQVERLADMLESIAELHYSRGWLRKLFDLLDHALQKLSIAKEKDYAVQLLYGRLTMWQGVTSSDFDTEENCKRCFHTSLTTFRRLGAQRELAVALSNYAIYGNHLSDNGDEPTAQESLNIFKQLDDARGIAIALKALGFASLHHENYPQAKERFQSGLGLIRELGDSKEIVHCLNGLGYTCWRMGEYQTAKEHLDEALELCKVTGDQYGISDCLGSLGIATYGLGDYQQSQEFFQASLALSKEIGSPWMIAGTIGDMAELAFARKDYLGADRLARESCAIYTSVGREKEDWQLRIMGNAALAMGNLEKARAHFCEALEEALNTQRWGHALLTLVGVAGLFAKNGKEEHALELLTLIMSHHACWQMAKDQAAPMITELEADLPSEVVKAAQERGRSRDLEATIQELLVELGGENHPKL